MSNPPLLMLHKDFSIMKPLPIAHSPFPNKTIQLFQQTLSIFKLCNKPSVVVANFSN